MEKELELQDFTWHYTNNYKEIIRKLFDGYYVRKKEWDKSITSAHILKDNKIVNNFGTGVVDKSLLSDSFAREGYEYAHPVNDKIPDIVEMTVADIEQLLGKKVKIIKG